MKSKIFTSVCVLVFMLIAFQSESYSQKIVTSGNNMGLSAAISLPSGIVPSITPGNVANNVGISYNSSVAFLYRFTQAVQGEVGLGFASISPESGDDISAFSLMAGLKYFLRLGNVMPYLNGAFSYSSVPKFDNFSESNLFSIFGSFGAQAFLNDQHTAALFIQIGIGFSAIDANGFKKSMVDLGGSAIGGSVYF